MGTENRETKKTAAHKEFVAGCPDCEDVRPAYEPNRVRRTIRRILKRATWPDIAEEIIEAIEKPYRKVQP